MSSSQLHGNRYGARAVLLMATAIAVSLALAAASAAFAVDSIDDCSRSELAYYRHLALISELAYDDSQPGLETTPSGCVALVREEADGALVIAFRGSMLGDRTPAHRFSNLGGAVIRRNYRDWVATNLKQTAGFLPRQYTEAAVLVKRHMLDRDNGAPVYLTGHSKGGGAATYAFVSVLLDDDIAPEQAARLRCVTFNAAVVREQNWRRLEREHRRTPDLAARRPADGAVTAVVMADDPVSKIASAEERAWVRRIVVDSRAARSSGEEHAIRAIIEEIEARLERLPEGRR
ncbi:MAG: hypothetical protein LUG50_08005 [Planctomycetaceae bacterium]|nr:hypothetical protein [Planctomycetaceae bacterium]